MVLVCLFGAIATSLLIVTQYQVVQDVREDTESSRLAGRDLEQLKVMMSQWYVVIDLFFEDGGSYVASGLEKQAEDMRTLWESLPTNVESVGENATNSDRENGALYISNAAQRISELAISGPLQTESWNKGLDFVDENTTLFAGLFDDSIHANEIELKLNADQLVVEQDLLASVSWAAAAIYLLAIVLAWMWANRNWITPPEQPGAPRCRGTARSFYSSVGLPRFNNLAVLLALT